MMHARSPPTKVISIFLAIVDPPGSRSSSFLNRLGPPSGPEIAMGGSNHTAMSKATNKTSFFMYGSRMKHVKRGATVQWTGARRSLDGEIVEVRCLAEVDDFDGIPAGFGWIPFDGQVVAGEG